MTFEEEYQSHLDTWGPNCGDPKSVYKGHLDKLLNVAIASERESCAKIAEGWTAVGGLQQPIAAAIRRRGSLLPQSQPSQMRP